jgi:tRNA threonylcarbamoyladenosine biosynthesis protein TsaE
MVMNTFDPAKRISKDKLEAWLEAHSKPQTLASLASTAALARSLAAVLPVDSTLALSGDLGSGKTTFVRFLAEALGIREPVKSPTFNLYAIYNGPIRLLHCDAYRLNDSAEMDALLLDEYLVSPWILCVEWPEHIPEWMPANALSLHFCIDNGVHSVALKNTSLKL